VKASPTYSTGQIMTKLGDRRRKRKVDENARWDVLVCTPAYDGKVDTDYSQSLAEAAFVSPLYQVKMNACVMANGAFIDMARNIFVKMFLNDYPEATHLFFIDSDLKFPPNAFIGLVRSGLPICAGVYRKRQEPEEYPVKFSVHPDGGVWVEDDWVMADRVPTGFLCISREVLEEMSETATKYRTKEQGELPNLFYTKIDDDGRFIGEDFAFCDDYVKKYNRPIPIWTNIDFEHGKHAGNLADFIELQLQETGEVRAKA
jgi:hypothetical protein